MSETTLDTSELKQLIKSAIAQILQEQKEVFADIMVEAVEDISLGKAITQGENNDSVSRETIFKILSQQ